MAGSSSVRSVLTVVGATLAAPHLAQAQTPPLVDVCSGLSVNLPVLQPVAGATSGLLAGLLDPVLNGIVGDVNVNLRDALSGRNIGVSVLDQNGNVVTTPGNCALKTNGVTVTNPGGITIGGGAITGLGSPSTLAPSAPDQNSIAFGNGASAAAGTTSAIAIGLRGSVTGLDGVAIGRDASAVAGGGVALGAGSLANRAGLAGAPEAFSGTAVASTMGAVSVGAAGSERQIANVAGGTQNTDAVNLRQLKAVGGNLANAIGGGATFNSTTGLFTGPTFTLRGGIYTDVASALAALDQSGGSANSGVIAANNTSANPAAVAAGADALSAGYGSSAAGQRSAAVGTLARASGSGSVAVGANASASAAGAIASGDNAVASGSGAIAMGQNASAGGAGSVAIGQGASAQPAGSVALGAGATATRANQVAVGTSANTYTMAGINSASSRAAQSGPTQVVTADAAGNLATANFDPRAIEQRLGGLGQDVAALGSYARESRREARQGIAAAMAMAPAPMPSAAGRTSWAGNTGVFKGDWAAGVAVAHRLNLATPIAISASASWSANSFGGGRLGVSGEF